jgi:hypothetical protein
VRGTSRFAADERTESHPEGGERGGRRRGGAHSSSNMRRFCTASIPASSPAPAMFSTLEAEERGGVTVAAAVCVVCTRRARAGPGERRINNGKRSAWRGPRGGGRAEIPGSGSFTCSRAFFTWGSWIQSVFFGPARVLWFPSVRTHGVMVSRISLFLCFKKTVSRNTHLRSRQIKQSWLKC